MRKILIFLGLVILSINVFSQTRVPSFRANYDPTTGMTIVRLAGDFYISYSTAGVYDSMFSSSAVIRRDGTGDFKYVVVRETSTFVGETTFLDNVNIVDYFKHYDDPNTYYLFNTDGIKLVAGGITGLEFIESASIDVIYLGDGPWDYIVIGDTTTSPVCVTTVTYPMGDWSMPHNLTVQEQIQAEHLIITSTMVADGGAVFNESATDVDFRVKALSEGNAFWVNGANGYVGINIAIPSGQLHLADVGSTEIIIDSFHSEAGYPYIILRKSDSSTSGSVAQTEALDILGGIRWQGVTASPVRAFGAGITVTQSGATGTYVPADLVLNTYSSTAENINQLVLHSDNSITFFGGVNTSTWTVDSLIFSTSTTSIIASEADVEFKTGAFSGVVNSSGIGGTSVSDYAEGDSSTTVIGTQNLYIVLKGTGVTDTQMAWCERYGDIGIKYVGKDARFMTLTIDVCGDNASGTNVNFGFKAYENGSFTTGMVIHASFPAQGEHQTVSVSKFLWVEPDDYFEIYIANLDGTEDFDTHHSYLTLD